MSFQNLVCPIQDRCQGYFDILSNNMLKISLSQTILHHVWSSIVHPGKYKPSFTSFQHSFRTNSWGKPHNLGANLNIPLSQTLVPCVAVASCGPRLLPSWPPLSQPQRPLFYPSILQPKQSDKRGFLIFGEISKLISFISIRISNILLRPVD